MSRSDAKARAANIDANIEGVPDYAKPIGRALRDLVRETAPELVGAVKWSRACWVGRRLVCAFAAFKEHAIFMFWRGEELKNRPGVRKLGLQEAALNGFVFRAGDSVPVADIRALIRAAVALDADESSKPRPRKKRPELPMPDDLGNAIRASAKAAKFFGTLPPSAKRDFIEWVTGAKRPETRAKRLAETVRTLAGGHRHNEQYR